METLVASLPETLFGAHSLKDSNPLGGVSQAEAGETPLVLSSPSGKGTVPTTVEEPGEGAHADT